MKTTAKSTAVMETTFELAKRIITIDRDRLNSIAAEQLDTDDVNIILGQKIEALNNALHWLGIYEIIEKEAQVQP